MSSIVQIIDYLIASRNCEANSNEIPLPGETEILLDTLLSERRHFLLELCIVDPTHTKRYQYLYSMI